MVVTVIILVIVLIVVASNKSDGKEEISASESIGASNLEDKAPSVPVYIPEPKKTCEDDHVLIG
jgi:hypothetical protein